MDKFTFQTSEMVCSESMTLEIEDGVIHSLKVTGGCPGNLFGISKLVAGMKVADVIARFDGISCGGKPTSCPDQLAKALKMYLEKKNASAK